MVKNFSGDCRVFNECNDGPLIATMGTDEQFIAIDSL
jgi:hypothetical protein